MTLSSNSAMVLMSAVIDHTIPHLPVVNTPSMAPAPASSQSATAIDTALVASPPLQPSMPLTPRLVQPTPPPLHLPLLGLHWPLWLPPKNVTTPPATCTYLGQVFEVPETVSNDQQLYLVMQGSRIGIFSDWQSTSPHIIGEAIEAGAVEILP
ncbi:hypothetical protein SERLA73DRAFT_149262 [Serpula lacrymans var. lacrymans S7.3]|uniref:Uncharacterized protein n=1 Tax=Serpula lacrymans var. lacrymans (strain S7.3) TaxID=936435 RepID=F8PH59_SERL3|nr:hypothetical protein SERLA73DRAFT_149262 [Serpula lacrymans var. lacrymans S7.3]